MASDPYFFLTYAHAPRVEGQSKDPDHLFEKIHTDLSVHIMQMTSHPHDAEVGYMDRRIRAGDDWWKDITSRLVRCRVLLALYSDRYFASESCGREWHAFTAREEIHEKVTGNTVHAVVPILWTPVDPAEMPPIVQPRQFIRSGLPERYNEEGLYGLAANGTYRDDYDVSTYEIAKTIVRIAKSTQLRPCETSQLPDLENVFERR